MYDWEERNHIEELIEPKLHSEPIIIPEAITDPKKAANKRKKKCTIF